MGVKEFWTYTAMRLLMFVASFAVVLGIWSLFTDQVPLLVVLLISLLLSGIASYFLLSRQRVALAARVEDRAGRMARRVQEAQAKEDAKDD